MGHIRVAMVSIAAWETASLPLRSAELTLEPSCSRTPGTWVNAVKPALDANSRRIAWKWGESVKIAWNVDK